MSPPPVLKLRLLWLAMGWAMLVAVVVLSLIPVNVDMAEGGDKWLHFIAYGSLMFWFCLLHDRQWRIAVAFVALGILLEFAQGQTGYRSFEYADMIANGLGVILGWIIAMTPLKHSLAWTERLFTSP